MTFRGNTQNLRNRRDRLAHILRRLPASAKQIARDIGRSPRTVENWRTERSGMSAEDLIALCKYDEVWAEVCQMAGRVATQSDAERVLDELAARISAARGRA